MMQSYLRNALLAIAALAALAFTPTTASAQSAAAVTITVAEPTEFAGQVLAPGSYVLKQDADWYLTVEESAGHRTIGFARYHSFSDRRGDQPLVTTTALNDGAPAKLAITSVYIPATGREYRFTTPEQRAASQPAARTDSAGK